MITPVAFWNMRFVGEQIIDPFGSFHLNVQTPPNQVDMDLAEGKVGHAVTLDPLDGDWLTGANGLTVATGDDFSLWFWVRRSSTGTNFAQLFFIANENGIELEVRWNSSDDMDVVGGLGVGEPAATVVVASDGDWHLVVVEYDEGSGEVSVWADNTSTATTAAVNPPNAGGSAHWVIGNTDNEWASFSDYDGGPIDIDAVGYVEYFLDSGERQELWGQDGEGREYEPGAASLLPHQLLAQDSTTNVSDDMGGDPPASYELRSQVDESAAKVTTTISSSTDVNEVPQQQAVIESQGGDQLGTTSIAPGTEVSASVDVTGADANVELRRTDE